MRVVSAFVAAVSALLVARRGLPETMGPLATATTALVVLFAAACAAGRSADSGEASIPPAESPGAAVATTPPPSEPAPPTCADWHNWNFFDRASVGLVRECLRAGADPQAPVNGAPAIFSAALTAADPDVISVLADAGADPNARLGPGLRGDGRPGYTPLHMAAERNPAAGIVAALLAAGADASARADDGRTPLHAAWSNHRDIVDALLRAGADPLARDERGRAADPTSCINWNTEAFSRLALGSEFESCLELGEEVNARDSDGNTPLHLAAEAANPSAATILLDAGADVNALSNNGATPLHMTVRNESADIMTSLLEAGADIDAGAGGLGTPLLLAIAYRGYATRRIGETAVNALLDAGADVNAADSQGTTPLLASMDPTRREGSLADLPLRLLTHGADPNRSDGQGRTPLHAAASAEGPEILRALLDAGADPRALTDEGSSPLHAAAGSGSADAIKLLIGAGADPNAVTRDSRTPLHLAVRAPRFALFGADDPSWRLRTFALIEAGADPNARTAEGDTPLHLHLSGRGSDTALVSGLVRSGADVDAPNAVGETPLHVARRHGDLPAANRLLQLGADPEARDHAGRIADPVCHWEPEGSSDYGWLARSPAESVQGCLESGIPVDARDEAGATFLARIVSARECCADFADVLAAFVASGADVNAPDSAGRTPLHRALANFGSMPARILRGVVSALLDAGADPNARHRGGWTPLHVAAGIFGESGPLVRMLAAAGADLDALNNAGETPLHLAQEAVATATVRTLLELGADPAAVDGVGATPDPVACERWSSEDFFALADADIVAACVAAGADVRAVVGRYPAAEPLHLAAAGARDPAVVRVLLEAGADMSARDDRLGYSALHHAAESGTGEVTRALLEAGADPHAWAMGYSVDWGWGWTPLHLAAKSNPDPDVVEALIEAGADLDASSGESYRKGYAPLHYAGSNPNPAVAGVLLDAGAGVNTRSVRDRTPLHVAAAYASDPAMIELLVEAGADVNARDANGYTPLHSAAWHNHRPEIATALIAAGADANARDPEGYAPSGRKANDRTPLFMSAHRGGGFISGQPMPSRHNIPVVEALARAGADLEQTTGSGRTALHAAARWSPAAFPILLRLGADPTVRDAEGRTPMDDALESRSLEGLPEVRRLREALRGGRAGSGQTCDDWGSHDFFRSASPEEVRECLQAGADPNGPPGLHPLPPLFAAAGATPHPAVISMLVAAGADVSARAWGGLTPLHEAAGRGAVAAVANALVAAGVDPNAQDRDGVAPLHLAARNGNQDVVTALVEAGAVVDVRGPVGDTPLHMSWSGVSLPSSGRVAVARELLRLGADPVAQNDSGLIADPTHCAHWQTAIFAHVAASADFARCVEEGADMHARDENGNTVLHRAASLDAAVTTLLLDAGARVNARNRIGRTPGENVNST